MHKKRYVILQISTKYDLTSHGGGYEYSLACDAVKSSTNVFGIHRYLPNYTASRTRTQLSSDQHQHGFMEVKTQRATTVSFNLHLTFNVQVYFRLICFSAVIYMSGQLTSSASDLHQALTAVTFPPNSTLAHMQVTNSRGNLHLRVHLARMSTLKINLYLGILARCS